MNLDQKLGKVGIVGRFRPPHNGSALLLTSACEQAEHVIIGIGSSNKYNARNPFSAQETREMIDAFLAGRFSNYEFREVEDFGHLPQFRDGQRWALEITKQYGSLDYFVSGNEYVKELLKDSYTIINGPSIIPPERWLKMSGTEVRMEMAKGGNWQALVPPEVAGYLKKEGLVERFRAEFGLETLAQLTDTGLYRRDSEAEKMRVTRE